MSIDSMQHTEQGRMIEFEIEDSPDERGEIQWIIYLPAIRSWESGRNDKPVAPERIPEILNRINLAFWKLDMDIKEIL